MSRKATLFDPLAASHERKMKKRVNSERLLGHHLKANNITVSAFGSSCRAFLASSFLPPGRPLRILLEPVWYEVKWYSECLSKHSWNPLPFDVLRSPLVFIARTLLFSWLFQHVDHQPNQQFDYVPFVGSSNKLHLPDDSFTDRQ